MPLLKCCSGRVNHMQNQRYYKWCFESVRVCVYLHVYNVKALCVECARSQSVRFGPVSFHYLPCENQQELAANITTAQCNCVLMHTLSFLLFMHHFSIIGLSLIFSLCCIFSFHLLFIIPSFRNRYKHFLWLRVQYVPVHCALMLFAVE